MFRASWVVLAVIAVSGAARAESEDARKAREEVEKQLHLLVGVQPAKVRVDFAPLDEPNYQLQDAIFELDGRALAAPKSELMKDGLHLVWNGDVVPGKHHVRSRVVYLNSSSPLLSEEGGNTIKVSGDVSFEVTAGIEVQVTVAPIRDGSQKDFSKRVRLTLPAKPVMLAKVDDSMLPEPVKQVVAEAVVDAGAPEAPVALAAKEPARIERPAPEALMGRPVRQPKPSRAPGVESPAAEPEPAPPVAEPAPAPSPEPVAVDTSPDAGVEVAVTPQPLPEPSFAWSAVGIGFGVAAIGLVALLARRRARPPTL